MSGYLHFNKTGIKEIDEIIEQLEDAGTAFHHTSDWSEECPYTTDKKSHLQLIQEALDGAANAYLSRCSGS